MIWKHSSQSSRILVLIDTWWNVNVTCGKNSPLMETVLIDTWWNVNSNYNQSLKEVFFVLIDTWWNVNSF